MSAREPSTPARTLQLTLDGRETAPPAPVRTDTWEAAPLFAAPQTIRGQLAMSATCSRCGAPRHPMADRGETCCGWERADRA